MDAYRVVLPAQAAVADPLHHLPCHIEHDGAANVGVYFNIEDMDGTDVVRAALRGRALMGRTVPVPHGYDGWLLEPHSGAYDASSTTPAEQVPVGMRGVKRFEQWTRWRHDMAPDVHNDAWLGALEWTRLAALIHEEDTDGASVENETIHKRKAPPLP